MQKRPRVLILAFSDVTRDIRVYRQIKFLQDFCDLTVAAWKAPALTIKFYPLRPSHYQGLAKVIKNVALKMRCYEYFYWHDPPVCSCLQALAHQQFDLIMANDIHTLPLALKLAADRARVLVDLHEYTPRQFEDSWRWRFWFQRYCQVLCRRYLPRAHAVTTVCAGLARAYQQNYGVTCEIIDNAAWYQAVEPTKVAADRIRLIHHGCAVPSRHLEYMVALVRHLDARFHLDMMLLATYPAYWRHLAALIERTPRVRLLPAVPMLEVPRCLQQYDIGLFMLPPVNYNYRQALPNKLFEYIQARLCVAIWPSIEMAQLVKKYRCGVVSPAFTIKSMAATLNQLSSNALEGYKQRAHQAAAQLNATNNQIKLQRLVRQLLQD